MLVLPGASPLLICPNGNAAAAGFNRATQVLAGGRLCSIFLCCLMETASHALTSTNCPTACPRRLSSAVHVGLACGARRGGCFSACQFFKCLILFKYSQVKRRRLQLNHLGVYSNFVPAEGQPVVGVRVEVLFFFFSAAAWVVLLA